MHACIHIIILKGGKTPLQVAEDAGYNFTADQFAKSRKVVSL